MAWFTLESIFVLTFLGELFLRLILKYQIEVLGEHELCFLVLPKILLTLSLKQLIRAVYHSKSLLLDKMFVFDILTVLVSCVDNFLIRFDQRELPLLRLVGLVRLMRLVRLLHLVKERRALGGRSKSMYSGIWCSGLHYRMYFMIEAIIIWYIYTVHLRIM